MTDSPDRRQPARPSSHRPPVARCQRLLQASAAQPQVLFCLALVVVTWIGLASHCAGLTDWRLAQLLVAGDDVSERAAARLSADLGRRFCWLGGCSHNT